MCQDCIKIIYVANQERMNLLHTLVVNRLSYLPSIFVDYRNNN